MRKGCLALLMGHCILGNGDLPQGSYALGLVAHCTAVTAVERLGKKDSEDSELL